MRLDEHDERDHAGVDEPGQNAETYEETNERRQVFLRKMARLDSIFERSLCRFALRKCDKTKNLELFSNSNEF